MNLSLFQIIALSLVQALTEFLPISSSGHLVVIPQLLGLPTQPLVFDTTLHLATSLSLLVFFSKDLLDIAFDLIKDLLKHKTHIKRFSHNGKMGLYVLIASIPAGIVGILFSDFLESTFRQLYYVSAFLIVGSILMLIAENVYEKIDAKSDLSYKKALIIGIFQTLALLPGISRSGSTISAGMLLGLSREYAAKFSFIMAVPIITFAAFFEFYDSYSLITFDINLLVGFLVTFVSGLFVIKFLLNFLKSHSIYVFVIYRVLLAIIVLFVYFVSMI